MTKKRNEKYLQDCEQFFDEMGLYLKISDDRLRINYDPELYNQIFKRFRQNIRESPNHFRIIFMVIWLKS